MKSKTSCRCLPWPTSPVNTSVPSGADQWSHESMKPSARRTSFSACQLAVNVPDDAHPLRAVLEKLRDVAMRGEGRLDRHVLHDHVFHLKDVELVGCQAEDEATASEILTGADIQFPGEEIAKVVVDGRVVLDVHFRREAQPAPMLHQSRRIVRTFVISTSGRSSIDLQGRAKLGERLLVVHPQDREGAVVDRVGRHAFEDGTEQSAERDAGAAYRVAHEGRC